MQIWCAIVNRVTFGRARYVCVLRTCTLTRLFKLFLFIICYRFVKRKKKRSARSNAFAADVQANANREIFAQQFNEKKTVYEFIRLSCDARKFAA